MIRSRQSSMCNCKKCDTKSMWLHVNDKKLPILVTGPVLVVSGTSPWKNIFFVLELKHQTLYKGGKHPSSHYRGGPDIEQGTESKEIIIYPCFIIKYVIDLVERHFVYLNHFLMFYDHGDITHMLLRKILLQLVEVIRTYNKHIFKKVQHYTIKLMFMNASRRLGLDMRKEEIHYSVLCITREWNKKRTFYHEFLTVSS